ncbi:peroxisomal membrane anchor protein conserved region-domain-containing protein [Talaromyces proteolyticus]|uniref:Peroxisomal membrane protein PEX14 n=1 Tax=Talaromyces proteolyticus TaxID=1131652 RepID=A0AAD4Q256_9EURO|nr:peroxisomal membrane anchor protein conserved region-domain-containing protein [Talaromyces proteolyticus]KAH8699268.1 peroxisomal membrane anchor protein conserved region-domain-containing protein [Talaromyces proteolyticus]
MTGDSKAAIPEWQRKASSLSDTTSSDDSSADVDTPGSETPTNFSEDSSSEAKSSLLEQAKTFLSDPSIRNASTTRKIEFLESKGLSGHEIEALLGVTRNEEASSVASAKEDNNRHQGRTTAPPAESSTISQTQTSTISNATAAATASSSTQRDIPPIITYPEFLVNSSAQNNKPPLLSLHGLLYTLYAAAGLGATIYGSSEFLVKPMLKTLTEYRHELAESALSNLATLNEKLEQNVSQVPPYTTSKSKSGDNDDVDDGDDTESITSDPTELFHRDVATQTSADLMTDEAATKNDPSSSEESNTKVIDTHTQSLSVLTSHLKEFLSDHTSSREVDDSARDKISDLQSYLDGLTYSSSSSYLGGNSMYNIYGSSGGDANRNRSGSTGRKEEDAIATFKAEIRGVKGALLSARNFPAGRAGITR